MYLILKPNQAIIHKPKNIKAISIFSPWYIFLISLLFHYSFSGKVLKENNHDIMRCHTGDKEILQIIAWEGKQNMFLSKLCVFLCSVGFQRWAIPRKHRCGIWCRNSSNYGQLPGGLLPKFLDEFTECIQFGFVL